MAPLPQVIGFPNGQWCSWALRRRLIEVYLSLVEKQWQAERNTNDARREDRRPSARKAESRSLNQHKGGQHDGRQNDIHSKEGTDAVCEKILNELPRVGPVRGEPREQERVRYDQANEAQTEVKVARFHLTSGRWIDTIKRHGRTIARNAARTTQEQALPKLLNYLKDWVGPRTATQSSQLSDGPRVPEWYVPIARSNAGTCLLLSVLCATLPIQEWQHS